MSNKPIKKRINFFQVQAYALSDKKKKENVKGGYKAIFN